jgi:penicillin-binding protein 2
MTVFSRRRRWRTTKRRNPGNGRESKNRMVALYALVLTVFVVLSLRLLSMQVIGGSQYRLEAEDNRLRVVQDTPMRGLIVDRAGRPLVANVPVFSVQIIPADLPREREGEVLQTLQSLLGVPTYQLERKVRERRRSIDPFQPVIVKTDVDYQTYLVLSERRRRLPGVVVADETTRYYPYGEALGHILGYTGRMFEDEVEDYQNRGYTPSERVGKAGVELTYEDLLRGTPGRRQVEVDATGRVIRTLAQEPKHSGATLVLSIDAELQKVVTDILKSSLAGLNSAKAVAMVMDVRTGELLASVSLPSYDNNIFSHPVDEEEYAKLINNPSKPLLNHAIAEKFAPGSTFKQITGIAALQEGIATTRTSITSRGTLLVPREFDPKTFDSFPDWNPNLGRLDFYRGVAMSSDIYFYCLAGGHCPEVPNGLGSTTLARYARMFGLGELTGIDLPGETDGLVGDAEWLRKATQGQQQWYTGDTFFMGIGQGYVEATPLQMVRLTAAIANGGSVLRPKVVHEVRDADGAVVIPPRTEVVRQVAVDPQNLQAMRDAMRLAIAEGTANKAAVPGVTVAGKTGTAEFGTRLGAGSVYGRYKEHGWVVAFAPFENPEIAVVVFNEEGSGAITAAPTASKIMDYYFNQRPKLSQAAPRRGP